MNEHRQGHATDAEVHAFILGYEEAEHANREELQRQYAKGYNDGKRAYWKRIVMRVRCVLVCLGWS